MIPVTVAPSRDSAVRAFVDRHQRGLQRWLRALGCDADRAEEHCQDALLAALHHGIDARPAPVAGRWLRTTAANLFRMRLRTERRQPPATGLEAVDVAWRAVHGDADGGDGALAALRDCLAAADANDRELIAQRYRDGRSRAAIATARGVGEPAIKQALRRARARLQRCIEHRLGDR